MSPEDDDVALHRDTILSHLKDLAGVAIDSDDPEKVGRVLLALDKIALELKGEKGVAVGYIGETESHLEACLAGREIPGVVVGPYRLNRSWVGAGRKGWAHKDLWSAVTRVAQEKAAGTTIQFDPETGERISELRLGVACAIDVVRKATPSPSWTQTGLRELEIDPDEFSSTSGGRWGIERHKVDPTTAEAY
jgi:hypothetical protein